MTAFRSRSAFATLVPGKTSSARAKSSSLPQSSPAHAARNSSSAESQLSSQVSRISRAIFRQSSHVGASILSALCRKQRRLARALCWNPRANELSAGARLQFLCVVLGWLRGLGAAQTREHCLLRNVPLETTHNGIYIYRNNYKLDLGAPAQNTASMNAAPDMSPRRPI